MTYEQMQHTMEFIVEQQARFTVNIQQLEEGFKRQEEERIRDRPRLARLEQSYQTVVELLKNYDSRMDDHVSRMDRVEGENSRLEIALARFTEKSDARIDRVEGESSRLETALARFTEKSDARIDRVEGESSRLETALARFTEKTDARMDRVEGESSRLENALARFAENSHLRVAELKSVLQTNMTALAAAQARTDEKLSALIDIVRQDRDRPRN